jgi:hypothetical protein
MKATGLGHHIRVRDGWALVTMESSFMRVTGKGSVAALNTIIAGTRTTTGTTIGIEKGTETITANSATIGVPLSIRRT